jgi:hypothetical protein
MVLDYQKRRFDKTNIFEENNKSEMPRFRLDVE